MPKTSHKIPAPGDSAKRLIDHPFPVSATRSWLPFGDAVRFSGLTAADFYGRVVDGDIGVTVARGDRFFFGGDVLRLRAKTALGVIRG